MYLYSKNVFGWMKTMEGVFESERADAHVCPPFTIMNQKMKERKKAKEVLPHEGKEKQNETVVRKEARSKNHRIHFIVDDGGMVGPSQCWSG